MALCPKCGSKMWHKGSQYINGYPRYKCKTCKRETQYPLEDVDGIDQELVQQYFESVKDESAFVITSAQNATPPNKKFLSSLLQYCKHRKAKLIVIPYRYKNPTSMWSKGGELDDWWHKDLAKYIIDKRFEINQNLVVLGDIRTQPTAEAPLNGFETITGSKSAIIGHPRLALKTVPTPQSRLAKILTTTGSVTVKNYIPTKAGKKAEHHHTYGAAVVEVVGNKFHLRQLNAAQDGSFMDLQHHYLPDRVKRIYRVKALFMGDTHEEWKDPKVVRATFGENGIVSTLNPEKLFWNDVHDFFSRTHHHYGEPFINVAKHFSNRDDVRAALERTFHFIDSVTPKDCINVFIPSNHPDALARWVKSADWRSDPKNAAFLLETALAMVSSTKMTKSGPSTIDPFVYWAKKMLKCADRCVFLERDESYPLMGIEPFHGDRGLNGAKGSIKSFARIGVKTITGHKHEAGIEGGCYQVGTNSLLRLGYNSGPSGWTHTDCVVYPNGKRSLINIIGGEWRG